MSTLLEQASLVMIPSGYKEDVVYSQIPTSGAGDLSFTRASNGTRVNSAGLVEVVPWNLAEQSETFNVSPWTAINVGITTNATTAPNGTTTAEKLMVTTANTPHQVQQGFNNDNANHTVFIYAKKSELNFVQLALGNSIEQYANFNLNTGVVGTKGTDCASSSIESVGNGWYKCSAYFNQGTIPSLMVYVTNSASSNWGGIDSFSGANNTDGIFVWGYQLNIGSTAKPYFPTTDRLNVPRLTYQNGGGGCPSLLLEKQSTNYLIYNTEIDNAAWVKARSTVTANATTSPDGTQNADGVFVNSDTNTNHEVFQYGTGSTEGWSAFFKANGYNFVYLFGSADPIVWFDLQNGTVGTAQSGASGKITNYGNGWYRCEYYKNSGTNSIWGFGIVPSNGVTTIASPDTSKGVYFWGAQGEAGLYSTSMIYTTSSSATRVADLATVNLPNTNMTFTAYLELDEASLGTPAGDWFSIFSNVSALGRAYGYANQFGFADAYSLGVSSGAKMVWKQESGSTAKIFKGGALVGTSTTGTYTDPFNRLRIDGALLDKSVKIKQFVFFDNALTDAECIQLTA